MALQSPIWGSENRAFPNARLPVRGLPSTSMIKAAPTTSPAGFTLSTSTANSGCPALPYVRITSLLDAVLLHFV